MMCLVCSQDKSKVGGMVIVSEGLPWVEREQIESWETQRTKPVGRSFRIEVGF